MAKKKDPLMSFKKRLHEIGDPVECKVCCKPIGVVPGDVYEVTCQWCGTVMQRIPKICITEKEQALVDWEKQNRDRGYDKLECIVRCMKCGDWIKGSIWFGKKNEIVDSWGFVVFSGGAKCDACTGEERTDQIKGVSLGKDFMDRAKVKP